MRASLAATLPLLLCKAAALIAPQAARVPAACTTLSINVTAPLFTTEEYYASWNVDPSRPRIFFDVNWTDPRLLYLVSHIGGGRIRFGGTGANYLFYDVGSAEGGCPPVIHFASECLNATLLDAVLALSAAADSPLLFGLNMRPPGAPRPPPLGPWNSTNARALLEYMHTKAPAQVAAFELGNEIAGTGAGQLSPSEYAAAYAILHALVDDVWGAGAASKPALVGPDKNSAGEGPYLAAFAVAAGANVSALTYHSYLDVTAVTVLEPTRMDKTTAAAANITAAVRAAVSPSVAIFAGEIGPHTGDGANSSFARCSDNKLCGRFGSVLWYADSMAATAVAGHAAYCRQDIVGADYALINTSAPGSGGATMTGGFTPAPDYYLLLLWKRLVGARVLDAGVNVTAAYTRPYAFCARGSGGASVTLVVINLSNDTSCVAVPTFAAGNLTVYSLTSGDVAEGVQAYTVRLNAGPPLALSADGRLPPLDGARVDAGGGPVPLPPQSVTLITVPAATPLPACAGSA